MNVMVIVRPPSRPAQRVEVVAVDRENIIVRQRTPSFSASEKVHHPPDPRIGLVGMV
jgi:hypothetical protein